MRIKIITLKTLFTSTLIVSPLSFASVASLDNSSLITQYTNCKKIENDTQRLRCFDTVDAVMPATKSEMTVAITDAPIVSVAPIVSTTSPMTVQSTMLSTTAENTIESTVESTVESTIESTSSKTPLTPPTITPPKSTQDDLNKKVTDDFGMENRPDPKRVDSITAIVSKISTDPRKKRTFTLNNGQIWREVESNRLRIKVNQTVHIERGALGSFRLGNESSTRKTRVKRIK